MGKIRFRYRKKVGDFKLKTIILTLTFMVFLNAIGQELASIVVGIFGLFSIIRQKRLDKEFYAHDIIIDKECLRIKLFDREIKIKWDGGFRYLKMESNGILVCDDIYQFLIRDTTENYKKLKHLILENAEKFNITVYGSC